MKYISITKKIVALSLIGISINQHYIKAEVDTVFTEQREIIFDCQVTSLMSECLFTISSDKSFVYYCSKLIELAEQNRDILATRLVIKRSKNNVQDFIETLKQMKTFTNPTKIGLELFKYMDVLPVELQKILKEAGPLKLRSLLDARLKK